MENSNILGVVFSIKKIILFMLIGLLCLSLVAKPVEAGWYEDTVNWLKELFGWGEEEIQNIFEITPTTSRKCVNGRCELLIHSGTRFIYEDEVWKKTEEARSFKGSGIECQVISDGINLAECLDWNATTRTVRLERKDNAIDIPLRKYIINKTGDRVYDTKFTTNIDFSLIAEKEFIIKTNPNDIIEFGENSTEIIITDADSGNLADGGPQSNNAGYHYTTFIMGNNGGQINRGYIKFTVNDTNIPDGQEIINATFQGWLSGSFGTEGTHSIYQVLDTDFTDLAVSTDIQVYPVLTWASQPCGTAFDNASSCNLTAMQTKPTPTGFTFWYYYDATDAVKRTYSEDEDLVGLVIKADNEGLDNQYAITNKEAGGNISILNITYQEENNPPIVDLQAPANETADYPAYINFTYNVTDKEDTIINCSLFLQHSFGDNWELNFTDNSITETINQTINITLAYENIYWKIGCYDTLHQQTNSSARNYTRLQSLPIVRLHYPTDNSNTTNKYINFTYNVSISSGSIDSCSLWLNGTLNQTDNNIEQLVNQTFNVTLNNSHWRNWEIECVDTEGEKANSSIYSFLFNTPPSIPTQNYPANATVSIGTTIILNCSYSTDSEDDTINYEFWNGTSSGSLKLGQNSTLTNFTLNIPVGDYYWRCKTNDNFSHSGYTPIRKIISVGSGAFNVTTTSACEYDLVPTMCFDFKDEENLTSYRVNIDYNFKLNVSSTSSITRNGDLTNISDFCLCINSSVYNNYSLTYGEVQYEKVGFVDRRYYTFTNTRLTNITINDTLMLLLNGDATSFLFEFVSTALSPYEHFYTTLNRWYPDLDTYDTVDMGITDNKGETIMRVVSEDVDYRVGLYYPNGTLVKLLDPIRFACLDSPCTYSALIQETPLDYVEFLNVQTNGIAYSSGIFTLVYNDPSQNTQEMTLKVYKETGSSTLELCTDTSTGFTGILTCDVSAYTGQLRAIAFRSASPEIPIAQKIINTVSTVFKGEIGLFISLFIFLILVFIGALYGPVPTLIFGVIALIPAVIFGTLTTEIVIGVGTLIGIAIHFMKRAGP